MSAFNDFILGFFKTTRFYKDVQNGYVVAIGAGETGEEITEEVFESHADEIFDEAENRLHAQKAVMVTLMERK